MPEEPLCTWEELEPEPEPEPEPPRWWCRCECDSVRRRAWLPSEDDDEEDWDDDDEEEPPPLEGSPLSRDGIRDQYR